MSPAMIWLCGWPLGTFAFYKAATRTWRNPERHRQWLLPRTYANQPVGIVAFALTALMFWWVYVLAAPLDVWRDARWQPEKGDDGDE